MNEEDNDIRPLDVDPNDPEVQKLARKMMFKLKLFAFIGAVVLLTAVVFGSYSAYHTFGTAGAIGASVVVVLLGLLIVRVIRVLL